MYNTHTHRIQYMIFSRPKSVVGTPNNKTTDVFIITTVATRRPFVWPRLGRR